MSVHSCPSNPCPICRSEIASKERFIEPQPIQRGEEMGTTVNWEARALAAEALLNTPEIVDFAKAVQLEAAHQRSRWGSDHDAGKADADWFWLLGYLGGKALRADDGIEKQLHRIITVAAAACNWHAAKLGQTNMRPGIEKPQGLGPDDFGINTRVPVLR